jgi:hypothetical protein
LLNDEFEIMWEEAFVNQLMYYCRIYAEGLKNTKKNLSIMLPPAEIRTKYLPNTYLDVHPSFL